jgi:Zinc-finger associated domain (zf-AD)
MKDDVTLLYIFEDADQGNESLASKIEKCTTLKMNPNDGLPDTICGYCNRDVEQAHNLQKLAISTSKILSRMFLIVEEVSEPPKPLAKRPRIVDASTAVAATTMNIRNDIFNSIFRKKPKKVEHELITDEIQVKGEVDSDQGQGVEDGLLEELQSADDTNEEMTEENEFPQDQGMEIEVEIDDDFGQASTEEEEEQDEEIPVLLVPETRGPKIKRKVHIKRVTSDDREEALQCNICLKYIHGAASMGR